MTAITTDVDRGNSDAPMALHSCKVYQSTSIPQGAIVSVVSGTGYAINGATALTHLVQGWAKDAVDNSSGSSGDKTVTIKSGVGYFSNGTNTDEITQADFGKPVFLGDNDTAVKTSGSGTRSILGVCLGLVTTELGTKVAVMVGPDISASLRNTLALGGGSVLSNFQIATGTITSGVCTINTGIVVTASTYAIGVPLAAITGSTNVGPIAFIDASKVVGAPSTGTIVFNVLSSAGSTDTDAAGTLVAFIFN